MGACRLCEQPLENDIALFLDGRNVSVEVCDFGGEIGRFPSAETYGTVGGIDDFSEIEHALGIAVALYKTRRRTVGHRFCFGLRVETEEKKIFDVQFEGSMIVNDVGRGLIE